MGRPQPADVPRADVCALLDEFLPDLCRILRRFRVPPRDQEDILQDVAVAFILKAPAIRDGRAWARAVLRNCCCSYWRDQVRRRQAEGRLASRAAAIPLDSPTERIDLERGLAGLPRGARRVLHLRFWVGLDEAEIAERTHYAKGSVDTTMRRGLATLREQLRTP